MPKFTSNDVRAHIRQFHPRCPEFAVEFFSREVASKRWQSCTLGMAVGITMQSFLRHNMSDYDQLLLEGVERHEAKRRVQARVNKMIALWGAVAPPGARCDDAV